MQNFIKPGDVITMVAPYDRLSGQGALVGSQFGVAKSDILSGVSGEFLTTGVVGPLAKTSAQSWAAGDSIYWDNTNKRCDNTVVGPKIGTAHAAAANPSATGEVKLSEAPALVPGAAVPVCAAAAAATAGGATPTAAQVDTGIAAAVAPLVVTINLLRTRLAAAGIVLP